MFAGLQLQITKTNILKPEAGHLSGSGLEDQGEPDLGALLNGLGVDLRGDGDQGLGPPLVLDECTCHAIVVEARLHSGQRVQGVLCPKGEGVLIAREAVSKLSSNSCGHIHQVVVRSSKAVPLVVPEMQNELSVVA